MPDGYIPCYYKGYKDSWQERVKERLPVFEDSVTQPPEDSRAQPPPHVNPNEEEANLGEAQRKKEVIREGKRKMGDSPKEPMRKFRRLRSIVIGGNREQGPILGGEEPPIPEDRESPAPKDKEPEKETVQEEVQGGGEEVRGEDVRSEEVRQVRSPPPPTRVEVPVVPEEPVHQEESAQSSAPRDPFFKVNEMVRLSRNLFPGQIPAVHQLDSSTPWKDTLKDWACQDISRGLQSYYLWQHMQQGAGSSNLSLKEMMELAHKNEKQRIALQLAKDSLKEAENKLKASEGSKTVAIKKMSEAIEEKDLIIRENSGLKDRIKELESSMEISDSNADLFRLEKQTLEQKLEALEKKFNTIFKENQALRGELDELKQQNKNLEAAATEWEEAYMESERDRLAAAESAPSPKEDREGYLQRFLCSSAFEDAALLLLKEEVVRSNYKMAKLIGRFHRQSPEDYGIFLPMEGDYPKTDFTKVSWREDRNILVWSDSGETVFVNADYLDPIKPKAPRRPSPEKPHRKSRSRSPTRRRRD